MTIILVLEMKTNTFNQNIDLIIFFIFYPTIISAVTADLNESELEIEDADQIDIDQDRQCPSSSNKVAFRYHPLPLQQKRPPPASVSGDLIPKPNIAAVPRRKKTAVRNNNKKPPVDDVYTAVRFKEQTEGTAADLDIQDASLTGDTGTEADDDDGDRSGGRIVKRRRTLLSSLKQIAEKQKRTLKQAAEVETSPFSFNQIAQLNYKSDDNGKGKFYSDSCAQCSLSVTFTVDGLRRLQFHVEINRHLLNLTQAQWECFRKLLHSLDEYEYKGWDGRRKGGGGGGALHYEEDEEEEEDNERRAVGGGNDSCCLIKRALNCLLKTTPKLGVNVGAIKFSTGVGAKPAYLKRMPENLIPNLDLTESIDARILKKLEEAVKSNRIKDKNIRN